MHNISAFGLRIFSDIDLSGVRCGAGAPDLVLRTRECPDQVLPVPGIQWGQDTDERKSWAVLPGLARVSMEDDTRVVIEPVSGLDQATLRAFAISTALPLALQRRDGFLLESSAVRWEGKALLLVGKGYCGKSTLAALISDRGASLLADSHSLVQASADGDITIAPGLPHVRLWPAQSELLAKNWPTPSLVRAGIKKRLYVVPERFSRTRSRVGGVVVLRRGVEKRFCVRRLRLNEALQELALANHRLRSKKIARSIEVCRFQIMSALAALPVCHVLQWPRGGGSVPEACDRLLGLLDGIGWSESV